jgi:uncharacterized protein (TIGR02145 family)
MSFIKNIELWNNQRPRVCDFDILDYCYVGGIGNTCTESTNAPNTEDSFLTARVTSDAWLKAVNEYFIASVSFYYDQGFNDSTVSSIVIPDGLLNEKCNPLSNYTELCALYYAQPDGFIMKSIDFKIKRAQLENSLLPDSDPNKKTGTYSYTESIPNSPFTAVPYTYTIDFTNYQTPDYDNYIEYRTILGDMMQQLKKIMTATGNHSFTPFTVPPICSGDITIGTQIWTQCNLDITNYRNGDTIPQVQDPTAWSNLTTGAWCYYQINSEDASQLGKLYNWYAVNDPRGLAPIGYHIPTDIEWSTLTNYLGGAIDAGDKLKKTGKSSRECVTLTNVVNWQTPNSFNVTNSTLFTALPGGYRDEFGSFTSAGYEGYWWTKTTDSTNTAWSRRMLYNTPEVERLSQNKNIGFSVRIIKD